MAQNVYHVGSTGTKITLSVAVSTAGIADTDPELINGTNSVDLNCISGPTGNLNNVFVGISNKLSGQTLGIGTLVDLQSVSPDLWPTMFSSFVIHYTLSGGPGGTQFFTTVASEIVKDSTGQYMKAYKSINLVP